jgi:hypothetical protein
MAPNQLCTTAIVLNRLPGEAISHPEQKDPSFIERAPEDYLNDVETPYRYIGYTTSGKSNGQQWKVARYGTNELKGAWQELKSPTIHGLSGPQLCAPALSYEFVDGKPSYHLYIQTACFEPGGVIMEAESTDGVTFHGKPEPLVTKDSIENPKCAVIGVYDPSYSQVIVDGKMHDCLTFTGITKINPSQPHQAMGDIYMMLRDRTVRGAKWSKPKLALDMKDISFHNQPKKAKEGKCTYEWCPEGTQVIGLDDTHYLMVGVCFLGREGLSDGERQRVFLAAADNINGPFVAFARPFKPVDARGENGHPDTVVDWKNQILEVILQERGNRLPDGKDAPWGLRHGEIELARLKPLMEEAVARRRQGLPDIDLTDHLRNSVLPIPETQVHHTRLSMPLSDIAQVEKRNPR